VYVQIRKGGQTILSGGLAVDDGGVKITTSDAVDNLLTLSIAMKPPNQYVSHWLRVSF
jgi:hypothetical protein